MENTARNTTAQTNFILLLSAERPSARFDTKHVGFLRKLSRSFYDHEKVCMGVVDMSVM